MSGIDALGDIGSLSELGEESSDEGVSGSVGVDEEVSSEGVDVILGDLALPGDDGAAGALGEDDGTGADARGLGHGGDLQCNGLEVLAVVSEAATGEEGSRERSPRSEATS